MRIRSAFISHINSKRLSGKRLLKRGYVGIFGLTRVIRADYDPAMINLATRAAPPLRLRLRLRLRLGLRLVIFAAVAILQIPSTYAT